MKTRHFVLGDVPIVVDVNDCHHVVAIYIGNHDVTTLLDKYYRKEIQNRITVDLLSNED